MSIAAWTVCAGGMSIAAWTVCAGGMSIANDVDRDAATHVATSTCMQDTPPA